jgi:hypothetical protein
MMKQSGVFKKLFFGFAIFFAFLTQGWGGDVCGVSSGFSATLNSTTPFTKSDSVGSTSDKYYFTAPAAGTVVVTLTGSNVKFTSSLTSCPSSSSGVTSQTLILSGDMDFNVNVYRTSSSGTKNYTITVSYSSATITVGQRDFALRNPMTSRNIKGNVAVIGNTVLCVDENYDGVCENYAGNNNNYLLNLIYIDKDNVNRTYNNSSQAQLAIPSTAVVKWAGIYTQGYLKKSIATSQTTATNIIKEPVYVTANTVGTISSTPMIVDMLQYGSDGYSYSTFAELSEFVGKSGGQLNGMITGANIKAGTGTSEIPGSFGAWTLVVVYEDSSETLKNVSVFDGYKRVSSEASYNNVEIPVSGFLTPRSGDVKSTLSIFVGEGDKSVTGDKLYLKAGSGSYVALNDTNAFYSTLKGIAANPSYENTQGIDIQNHGVGVDGDGTHKQIIGNNITSATIKFTSSLDVYYPSVAVFATELYVPDVCYEEIVSKNGSVVTGYVDIGDVLDIDVTVKNIGQEQAVGVSVEKQYDPQMPYVTGSMYVKNLGELAYSARTDAIGDDIAEYKTDTGTTKYYIGSGASFSGGGILSYNEGASFKYQVSVQEFINRSLQNKYLVSYQNLQLGIPFSGIPMNTCSGSPTPITIKNPNMITQCGLFPDAISSRTSILLDPATNTITNSGVSMTAPILTNQSTSMCDGILCTANGDKPYAIVLPTFYTSGVTSDTFIAASTSFVDEQIGNIVLQGSPPAEGIKVSFSAPSSPSYDAKVMYIKGITNNLSVPVELNFTEGDYWIDNFVLQGGSSTIKTTGKVRLFVNNRMFINGSQFTLSSAGNTYIFAYQGFTAHASNSMSFENTYVYSKKEIFFENASTQGVVFSGAITSEEKVTIHMSKESTFTYRSTDLSVDGYGSCNTTANYPFDAWEMTGGVSVKNIYTKLYGISFDLVIASLNDGRTELVARDAAVSVSIVDADNKDIAYSDTQTITFANQSTQSATFTATKAAQNARIKIINSDASATACTSAAPCYSTDTFTIRPQYLSVSTPMPLVQKAGDNTNIIAINTNAPGYNQSLSKLTFKISKWLALNGANLGATPAITDGLALEGTAFSSLAGNTTDAVFKFPDVGRFAVDINDTQWAVGSKDIENTDCSSARTDYASANDLIGGKYGCYVMLNPQSGIDLRFIPDYFNVTGGAITNANGGSFTYFSNDLAAQAATIPMTITAVNKLEETTKNYSNGLYAQTINNIPTVSADGYTKVDQSPTVNFVNGVKDMTGSNAFKFNFQRSVNAYLNPLTVDSSKISGLTITDTDGVTGALSVSGSAVFLYGKVSMPNAMVDYSDTGADIRAFAQVYATSSASLPSGSTWVQAPGSTNWWINSLDSTSASSLPHVYVRKSDALTALSNEVGSITSPATVAAGVATMKLQPTNTDQKLKIHLDVPSYLWYSSAGVAYDFTTTSDCTKHPCAWVDVFATAANTWFGEGKKDDKAIKAVPKGKRKPKVNW